jgi:hypothetical protein
VHDVGFEPTKLTQQILSLSPLTARETVLFLNLPFYCLMNYIRLYINSIYFHFLSCVMCVHLILIQFIFIFCLVLCVMCVHLILIQFMFIFLSCVMFFITLQILYLVNLYIDV